MVLKASHPSTPCEADVLTKELCRNCHSNARCNSGQHIAMMHAAGPHILPPMVCHIAFKNGQRVLDAIIHIASFAGRHEAHELQAVKTFAYTSCLETHMQANMQRITSLEDCMW